MSNSVQPKVLIEVAHKDHYKDSFFERCVGQVVRDERLVDRLPDWMPLHLNSEANPASFMVWYYEDKTLKEMRTKTGSAYQKLFNDMKFVADTLHCNVTVYLGHREICENYVQTSYKTSVSEANQSEFTLPTVFLIIACYTKLMADKLNTDSVFIGKNIGFFGFEDFIHIHEGEIYGCKDVHKAPPSLDCSYDNVQKNLYSLLELDKNGAKKTVNNVRQKKLNLENPLVECCESKEAAMYDLFIRYLDQRNCVKFPKETLVEKFRPFVTNPNNRSFLVSPNTTFQAADGIPCINGSCAIPNPYAEAAKKSKVYNDLSTKKKLYNAILGSWNEGLSSFSKKIESIQEKDGGIFTYKYGDNKDEPPLLAILLENKRNYDLKKIYSLLLSIFKTYGKYLNFDIRYGEDKDTLLHTIRRSNLPEGKQYFLYKKVYELVKPEQRETLFFQINADNQIPLEMGSRLEKKLPLLILLFYLEFFGAKLKDVNPLITYGFRGNLLHSLLLYQYNHYNQYGSYKINYNDQKKNNINLNSNNNVLLTCLKGLLEVGVDPNMTLKKVLPNQKFELSEENLSFLQSLKPLQLHLYLYKPPHDSNDIIKLFLSYGMTNTDKYFTNQYEFYSKQIESSETFTHYIASLNNLYESLKEEIGNISTIKGASKGTNIDRNVQIYTQAFSELLPAITNNIRLFKQSLSYDDGIKLAEGNVEVFKQALLFFAIQKRKNFKERIAKTRKNSKTNFNQTLKKYTNNMTFLYNINRLLRSRMKEIDDFIKYGTFTKQEKATHRENTIAIKQMTNLAPKTIYEILGDHLKDLQRISNLNKEINKVQKEIKQALLTLNEDEEFKNSFRIGVETILANDEKYSLAEKLEKIKEQLQTIKDWPLMKKIWSIQEEIDTKLNSLPNTNNRKQRYKNQVNGLSENQTISNQQYFEQLQQILREISV